MPESITLRSGMNAAERVALGAAELDEKKPGWEKRLELRVLNLSDGCLCVLGQVYGLYSVGMEELYGLGGSTFEQREAHAAWAENHGFLASWPDDGAVAYREELQALEAEWRKVVYQRREKSHADR